MKDDIFIDVNCDLGEGIGNEKLLMPMISSCNIACGGHAGDEQTMSEVSILAKKNSVKVGAHPSYPDRENFGRVSMEMENSDLIESIQDQMSRFMSILNQENIPLHHIKPHGALYNDMRLDIQLTRTFLKSIERFKENTILFVPYGSELQKEAMRLGFTVKREAFADRGYNMNLSLVSRHEPDAVISEPETVLQNLLRIVNNEHVLTKEDNKVFIKAETICIHGDNPSAVEILNHLTKELPKHRIHIKR